MGEHVAIVVAYTGLCAFIVMVVLAYAQDKKRRLTLGQKVTFVVLTLCVGGLFLKPVAHEGYRPASKVEKWQTHAGTIATGTSANLPYLVTDAGYRVVTRDAQPYKAGAPISFACPPRGRGEVCELADTKVYTTWTSKFTWAYVVRSVVAMLLFGGCVLLAIRRLRRAGKL